MNIEQRPPATVILLSIVTCGFYLIYWYARIYEELQQLSGKTPTGNPYILDFLLVLLTCGLWGIYVDYQISMTLNELQKQKGMMVNDTSMLVVVLDVSAYLTMYFTGFVSSAIQQDQLNKITALPGSNNASPLAPPPTTGPITPSSPYTYTPPGNQQADSDKNPYS